MAKHVYEMEKRRLVELEPIICTHVSFQTWNEGVDTQQTPNETRQKCCCFRIIGRWDYKLLLLLLHTWFRSWPGWLNSFSQRVRALDESGIWWVSILHMPDRSSTHMVFERRLEYQHHTNEPRQGQWAPKVSDVHWGSRDIIRLTIPFHIICYTKLLLLLWWWWFLT